MDKIIREVGHEKSWERMHELKVTPWHQGVPALALQDAVGKTPENGLFLVPGCGQGLDVQFLAQQRPLARVFGLDLSELVIEEAKRNVKESNTSFISGDFFKTEELERNAFSFIFDYTFLCALLPVKRQAWADRMKELIKPGGMLMTLMYPLEDYSIDKGPPFSLSVETYFELLKDGFKLEALEKCRSPPRREGKEKLGIWIRKSV